MVDLGETIGAAGLRQWRFEPDGSDSPVSVWESLRDGLISNADYATYLPGPVARLNVGMEYADLTYSEVQRLLAILARWSELNPPRDSAAQDDKDD